MKLKILLMPLFLILIALGVTGCGSDDKATTEGNVTIKGSGSST